MQVHNPCAHVPLDALIPHLRAFVTSCCHYSSRDAIALLTPYSRRASKETVTPLPSSYSAIPLQAPEHLDYFEVTSSLCDTLTQLYRKFMDESCAAPHVLEALDTIDQKLKV